MACVVSFGATSFADGTGQLSPGSRDLSEASRLLEDQQPRQALAYLARCVRSDPGSVAARSTLLDLLLRRSWPLPAGQRSEREVTASEDSAARSSMVPAGDAFHPLMRHDNRVFFAQFSPDGERVVTASMDRTARLWDARTGEPIGKSMPHDSLVIDAQFSPDGKRVVTASFDSTARLWDARTGESLGEPMKHGASFVYSPRFSPDGRRVVTASFDSTARLWDGHTGKSLGPPMKHAGRVRSAQFSPDGGRVVTASWSDSTARQWDARTSEPLGRQMRHQRGLYAAEFSPDGGRVLTASFDSTARLWDARTGEPLGEPMRHRGALYSARFSPDGQRVVTAAFDSTARLWSSHTGQGLGRPMIHAKRVYSATFSPDGERVATASADGTVRLWDAHTGEPLGGPIEHPGWAYSAEFSRDGQRLIVAALSAPVRGLVVPGAARVWDTPTASAADARLLAALAEAVSGYWLNAAGALTPVDDPAGRLDALRREVAGAPVGGTSGASLTRWILADRRTRTISPSATVTLDAYVRSELETMMDSDQGLRGRLHELSIKGDTSSTEYRSLLGQQQAVDEEHLQRLKEIVTRDGWPKRSVVGDNAATAAFSIVQHADLATQKEYLPLLKAAVAAGEARAVDLALLEDRVLRAIREPRNK